jgi:membrane-associated phospholipid phosphatase
MIQPIRLAITGICLGLFSLAVQAQQPDTLIKKLDSLRKSNDTTGKQINNTAPEAFTESTVITFPAYFILLGSNMKQSFTKPFRMKKKDWRNLLVFGGAEVALVFADEPIQRWAGDLRNDNRTVSGISKYVTQFGGLYEVYTLAALAAEGFIFKNQKLKTTTLLATQSYLTAGAVQFVGKFLSGRQRPSYADNYTLDAEPSFHGPFYKLVDANGNRSNSSFPSGHTTAAFAAATVYSLEYKDKKLVPWISYGVATLIGLSRITENKHWFTDILAGATLGYLTGQQVVNNYHRYAKIRSGEIQEEKKNKLSFNLGYAEGVIMPGLVYQFR